MVELGFGLDPLEAQFAVASQLEDQEQWEGAYKNYNEVVIKAKNVIANQPNTPVKNELV